MGVQMAVFKVKLAGRWTEKEGYVRIANDDDDAANEDGDESEGSNEE